jgi:Tfp pilus assembly protein PilO
VTDLLRLAKAMPGSVDQASLVLELSRLAEASRVTLAAVTPQAPVVTADGATALPVGVSVGGRYFDVVRFLRNTRGLVSLRGGKLRATGRLFTVESLELAESSSKRFPELDATIALHAYVYDGPIAPPEKAEPPSEELEPTGASAAGSTP